MIIFSYTYVAIELATIDNIMTINSMCEFGAENIGSYILHDGKQGGGIYFTINH